jgi:DDE family transposase
MTVSQSASLVQFEELDETIKTVLGSTANTLAREKKFVQRKSKIDGAHFAQALIFGWLADPNASYTFLQQMLETTGCDASAQALEQRMNEQAADFLLALIFVLVGTCISSDPVSTELFSRFNGVYLQDGTIISLPNELEGIYKGSGGNTSESGKSALRIQVRLNMGNGALHGPWISSAKTCERAGAGSLEIDPLPVGSLRITDSAYVPLQVLKEQKEQGTYMMSHVRADTTITDARGIQSSVQEFLLKRLVTQEKVDEEVTIGKREITQQKVRIIAFRVSAATEKKRLERVGKQTKHKAKGSRGDTCVGKKKRPTKTTTHRDKTGRARRALSGYTVLFTTVPKELLETHEVQALIRSRWQIELLWRLWKERGKIDLWRSEKTMRILCEVYAKLIGCIIQHWIILKGCWQQPNRSLVKASQAVTFLISGYLLSWSGPLTSADFLVAMAQAMKRAQLNRRPVRLSTAQLLEQASHKQALA